MKKILVSLALWSGFAFAAVDLSPLKTAQATLSILTDAQGQTIYTYDPDTLGVSNCNGACARAWPPVPAPEGELKAPLSAVTRQDGSKQLAFKGHPLYLYIDDSAPGDITGDGKGGIWHVVHP